MTKKLSQLENKISGNFSNIKSIKEGESSSEKTKSLKTQKVPSLNLEKV